jgi:hypothetical protein
MRVPQNISQTIGAPAMLLVSSEQGAKFYFIENGKINELDSFVVEKPKYTDKEGSFQNKVPNAKGAVRGGAAKENLNEKALQDFRKRLKKHISDILKEHSIPKVYLFCPEHLKNYVTESLPKVIKNKIAITYTGNFYKTHPSLLLDRITKKIENQKKSKKVVATKEEAQKVLKL